MRCGRVNASIPASCAIHLLPYRASKLRRLSAGLLLLSLLHDLLDNLLLLDQESAGDAVLDAVGAARATVCALDGLLWVRDLGVFAWAEGWDLLFTSVSPLSYFPHVFH